MTTEIGKWCYSTDEEEYNGHCETEADAHGEAQCQIDEDGEEDEDRDYWIAKIVHPLDTISHDIGDDIMEMINERVSDEAGGDDEALDISREHESELGALIIAFIREHAAVQRYGIKDPVKHQYITGSNA